MVDWSTHWLTMAEAMSGLFWWSAETRSMCMPLQAAARQSSIAIWAATTEPWPLCADRLPDMSVMTPSLTEGGAGERNRREQQRGEKKASHSAARNCEGSAPTRWLSSSSPTERRKS